MHHAAQESRSDRHVNRAHGAVACRFFAFIGGIFVRAMRDARLPRGRRVRGRTHTAVRRIATLLSTLLWGRLCKPLRAGREVGIF